MQRLLEQRRRRGGLPERADSTPARRRVMLFDSWGGVLADGLPALQPAYTARRVLAQLKRTTPAARACRASSSPRAAACGCPTCWTAALRHAGPGLDHGPGRARQLLAAPVAPVSGAGRAYPVPAATFDPQNPVPKALQGNIDPNVLFAPPEAIRAEVRRVLDSFGRRTATRPRAASRTSSTWATASASSPRPSTCARAGGSGACQHSRAQLRLKIRSAASGAGPDRSPTRASRAQNRCRQALGPRFREK
jgi:hypothetical protein